MTALLAEFTSVEALLAAIAAAHHRGLKPLDAFTPFYVEGLDRALGIEDQRTNWLGFAGLVAGALLGWGMQWYANIDYPLNIGGRPALAPPSFTVLTFEFAVLLGAFFLFFGLLVLNRLPKLHHPLFEVPQFAGATSDRAFLLIDGSDEATRRAVEDLQPQSIVEVGAEVTS